MFKDFDKRDIKQYIINNEQMKLYESYDKTALPVPNDSSHKKYS